MVTVHGIPAAPGIDGVTVYEMGAPPTGGPANDAVKVEPLPVDGVAPAGVTDHV